MGSSPALRSINYYSDYTVVRCVVCARWARTAAPRILIFLSKGRRQSRVQRSSCTAVLLAATDENNIAQCRVRAQTRPALGSSIRPVTSQDRAVERCTSAQAPLLALPWCSLHSPLAHTHARPHLRFPHIRLLPFPYDFKQHPPSPFPHSAGVSVVELRRPCPSAQRHLGMGKRGQR